MRIILLLSMATMYTTYAMDKEEPVACGSVTLGYCIRVMVGQGQERTPLIGNIQHETVEERTCKECMRQHRGKICCCGLCCCIACTGSTFAAVNGFVSSIKTIQSWFE